MEKNKKKTKQNCAYGHAGLTLFMPQLVEHFRKKKIEGKWEGLGESQRGGGGRETGGRTRAICKTSASHLL